MILWFLIIIPIIISFLVLVAVTVTSFIHKSKIEELYVKLGNQGKT